MNTSSSSSNGLRSHPVVRAICNYLDPRSATKSTVHGLDDAKPSQKYTLYARSSISVPQGSVMIGAFMPTVFSGSTTPDLFVRVLPAGSLSTVISTDPGTLTAGWGLLNHYAIDNPAATGMSGYDFRIPAANLKITYAGAELYRGGVIHTYMQDSAEVWNNVIAGTGQAFATAAATYADIRTLCSQYSQARAISLVDHPTIEFNVHASSERWFNDSTCSGSCIPEQQDGLATDLANGSQLLALGTNPDTSVGRPCVAFAFTNTGPSGSTADFLFESIVHVERYSASTIPLNTPSVSAGSEVQSVVTAFKKHVSANHHGLPAKVSGVKAIKAMWPTFKKYAPPGIATSMVDVAVSLL